MKKQLVDVLAPIYQQYLAFCDANGVRLDFDLAEPTLAVEWSDELDNLAKALIDDALRRLRKGETLLIGANFREGKPVLIIKDSGKALSSEDCRARETDMVHYSSRYGFGTVAEVDL